MEGGYFVLSEAFDSLFRGGKYNKKQHVFILMQNPLSLSRCCADPMHLLHTQEFPDLFDRLALSGRSLACSVSVSQVVSCCSFACRTSCISQLSIMLQKTMQKTNLYFIVVIVLNQFLPLALS